MNFYCVINKLYLRANSKPFMLTEDDQHKTKVVASFLFIITVLGNLLKLCRSVA